MKPTLLILAAGMASRYGSMKQVDGFGPNGETIIDYSIYDAIKAGFGKISFIIREEFVDSFKSKFEPKLNGKIETEYVFQTFNLKPYGIDQEIERAKPWGTAHAVLEAKNQVQEPFCVINADDFYGAEAFEKMAAFLTGEVSDNHFSLMGYQMDKTLSENGSVSRGVCKVDENNNLIEINERLKVYEKDGAIVYEENGVETPLHEDPRASMNFWGFSPAIYGLMQPMFKKFVEANAADPKSEFLLPKAADELIKAGQASFKVIPTSAQWFGVTYKEDKPVVQQKISELVTNGTYPSNLWG